MAAQPTHMDIGVDVNLELKVKQGLVVRPGDTLVLALDERVTDEQAHCLDKDFRRFLPDVRVVLVRGIEQMAVIPVGEEGAELLSLPQETEAS